MMTPRMPMKQLDTSNPTTGLSDAIEFQVGP
jgi:hypothetical protein